MNKISLEKAKIWLADLTYTQQAVAADTIPMAIGGIATYLESRVRLESPVKLFKYPESLIAALESGAPDVIGFSNYVWNYELSRKFAQLVRRINPKVVIVFGGPNYPIDFASRCEFLQLNANVFDYYIVGEGEEPFFDLVSYLFNQGFERSSDTSKAPQSVHYLGQGGPVFKDKRPRLSDLDTIPSPYTSGKLDEFFDGRLMPLIQTNRGCPFSCTFCVEGDSYYSKVRKYSKDRVSNDITYIADMVDTKFLSHHRRDLFIADSNFGMYPEDKHTAECLAVSKATSGWPNYINVATGKNSKERVLEVADILDGSLRLSGSVQSLDTEVLGNIKRDNISADKLIELGLRSASLGVNSYSEIILGLPGDSKIKHFETIRLIMEAGFNVILPWQLMFINGSELNVPAERAKYAMDSKFRVLPRCFGRWDVSALGIDGFTQLASVEIEEVCISSRTLSFEDYLECRLFNLIVTIFYNDALFSPVVLFLRSYGCSPFDLMLEIRDNANLRCKQEIVSPFLADTISELWEDSDELEHSVLDGDTISKYINGELGYNILFYHRVRAQCEYIEVIADLLAESASKVLFSRRVSDPVAHDFLSDLVKFCSYLVHDLLSVEAIPVTVSLNYRIHAWLEDNSLDLVQIKQKSTYEFYYDDQTVSLAAQSLDAHGSGLVGKARILSRIFVKKLYRKYRLIDDHCVVSST